MKKIRIKYSIHEYFLKFILINLIYFVLAGKFNNKNRNLNNINIIKLKILDDGIKDSKCLKVFSEYGLKYPNSVYLNGEKKDLQKGELFILVEMI